MSHAASQATLFRKFSALDHYDYWELDRYCVCEICTEWRDRLKIFLTAQALVDTRVCDLEACAADMKGPCNDCRSGMRTRASFQAANNRRDLYSECSWHASLMDPPALGTVFMAWLTRIIANRTVRKDSWWVGKQPYLPVQYWLTMFRLAATQGTLNDDGLFVDMDGLPRHGATLNSETLL